MSAMTRALVALALLAAAPLLEAQQARRAERRCRLELVRVARQGVRVETAPGVVNLFAGGDVHVRCVGQRVNMYADSVAIFGESVAQFLGNVRYVDSVTTINADFGQYNRLPQDEYFDAQGRVVHRDLRSGSSIEGPRVLYYRALEGVRPDGEVQADQRPTVKYVLDTMPGEREPYLVVGDRVRMAGRDVLNAWGRVTVDRSDLRARADTMWIDSGVLGKGQLQGRASIAGVGRDSFELVGRVIDLALADRRLSGLKSRGDARLVGQDVTLSADSIRLDLAAGNVERTAAWGATRRPHAVSAEYEVRGDSLLIESPGRRLRALRAWGDAWLGLRPDSAEGERDWVAGGRVEVSFVDRDSAGVARATVREVLAERQARTFYRMAPEQRGALASVNYTRADRILITMRVDTDSTAVERVLATGNVDGAHLQPAPPGTRPDTAAARRPPPAAPPPGEGSRP
jgi:hypothetical protein